MRGFYRDGEWVSASVGAAGGVGVEMAEQAVREAIRRVEVSEITARQALRALLQGHPCLKNDQPNHPLLPLMSYYAEEVMGDYKSKN